MIIEAMEHDNYLPDKLDTYQTTIRIENVHPNSEQSLWSDTITLTGTRGAKAKS